MLIERKHRREQLRLGYVRKYAKKKKKKKKGVTTSLLANAEHSHHMAGKIGHDSTAARFGAATAASDFSIEADKPYSEVGRAPLSQQQSTKLSAKEIANTGISYGWEHTKHYLPEIL